jgi:hypothetical protein
VGDYFFDSAFADIDSVKYLRVILLEDGKTIHNAFFDRRYKEEK